MIDIVIPTVPGREADLECCLASYEQYTEHPHRVIVIEDSPSSGEGWLQGIVKSTAPYVHLSCDDLEIIDAGWAEACMEAADADKLACPVVYRPDLTLESCGGDMNAPNCLLDQMAPDMTPVDFTTVPFMSRKQIGEIGMLPIHYSSDVWASYRGRQLGYETVVRTAYRFVHYQSQVKRGAGMSQHERAAQDRQTMEAALAAVE